MMSGSSRDKILGCWRNINGGKDTWGGRGKMKAVKVAGKVLWGENCNVDSVKD